MRRKMDCFEPESGTYFGNSALGLLLESEEVGVGGSEEVIVEDWEIGGMELEESLEMAEGESVTESLICGVFNL